MTPIGGRRTAREASIATPRAIALLLPLALLAGAWGSQLIGHLYPCHMCLWQRWPHYAAVVLAGLAYVVPGISAKRMLVVLAAVAIGVSGAIGVFHAGVEYHWWNGITDCTSSIRAGGGDVLAQIMRAPIVRCDVPQWTLFGISLAGFNAIFSCAGAFTILVLMRNAR